MDCTQCETELVAYLDGEASDAVAVEGHLAECEACRGRLAYLRSTVALLHAGWAADAPGEPEALPLAREGWRSWRLAAAAAVLVVVVPGALLLPSLGGGGAGSEGLVGWVTDFAARQHSTMAQGSGSGGGHGSYVAWRQHNRRGKFELSPTSPLSEDDESGEAPGSDGAGSGSGGALDLAQYKELLAKYRTVLNQQQKQQLRLGMIAALDGGGGDRYQSLPGNVFKIVARHRESTFSADVDTASYANVRRFLREGRLPPKGAVRIEEMINYFSYDYGQAKAGEPFAVDLEVAGCPWNAKHRVLRIGLQAPRVATAQRPRANLVFLLDVSGSMSSPDKLGLIKDAMLLLVNQLRPDDRVAIVVYAGAAGLALPSTPAGHAGKIRAAIGALSSGGSTAGGAGIQLAYRVAAEQFVEGGINRVILATDGDFNVGTTSQQALVELIEDKRKSGVFLTVLGVGRGNLNDAMMEELSNKGNGTYAYLDSKAEARKVLSAQVGSTLVTVAKDVKLQLSFNPKVVESYRLLGYENRVMANRDFADDTKDAGDVGAGHTVTALYEIVPVEEPADEAMAELRLRYKRPAGSTSTLLTYAVRDRGATYGAASPDYQFALAVAEFGMRLRQGKGATFDAVIELASAGLEPLPTGPRPDLAARKELIALAKIAKGLAN